MKLFSRGINEYICESLYKSANNSIIAHAVGISAILYFFGHGIPPQVLNIIVILTTVVIISRFFITSFFLRNYPSSIKDIKFWYVLFLFGIAGTSLIWSLMAVYFVSTQNPSYQIMIVTMSFGFLAGSIVTLSVDKLSVLIFTQPITFAVLICLVLTGDEVLKVTAFLLMLLDIPIFMYSLTSSESSHKLYQSAVIEKKMNAAKTDFLAKMTHELRTPMHAVVGIGYLLEKTGLSDKQKSYIKKLQYASDSLLGIINNILDFSRIEARQLELEHAPFKLAGVINTIKALVEVQAQKKSLAFEIIIDDTTKSLTLVGDSLRLTQVLINLTMNSVKFTQSGSVTISVEQINSDEHQVNLTFKVSDTGIGIHDEDKAVLFESFSQLSSSDSRKYSGAGLGLAISQNLVELMGGRIEVDSIVGQGSVFYFSICLEYNRDSDVHEGNSRDSAISLLEKIPELEGKLVLLADDNDLSLMVGEAVLEMLGPKVIVANGARKVFEILENTSPELILMDLQMPEVTGYEALAIIKNNPEWKNIPVIALTANASDVEKKRALSHGMDGFLTKPMDLNQLREILMKWLVSNDQNKSASSAQT